MTFFIRIKIFQLFPIPSHDSYKLTVRTRIMAGADSLSHTLPTPFTPHLTLLAFIFFIIER